MITDPSDRRPGRTLPRPPRVDRGLDRRHGDDREVRFPHQPGERHHQDRWGRRLAPGRDHVRIINDRVIIDNIHRHERTWNRHNHHGYEWHHWNGHRVGHHYDRYRRHWWGFTIGSVFFWTRHHEGFYWWYDPYFHRWVYLHEGRWWYRDPGSMSVVYVYDDGRYYQYRDARGGVVLIPDATPPADPAPSDPSAPAQPERETYVSEDGTREVQIFGDTRDAFLYDTSETPAFEPEFLASDVKEVQFSTGGAGELQVMLVIEKTVNGQAQRSFRIFDRDGYSLTDPAPTAEDLRGTSESFRQLETEALPQ